MSAPLLPSPLAHSLYAKKDPVRRYRATLLALFALIGLSCYVLFITNPALAMSKAHPGSDGFRASPLPVVMLNEVIPVPKPHLNYRPIKLPSSHLPLSQREELAALSAFLAALPQNRLPSSVNPDEPLDPQLILDFDPSSESAREELDKIVEEVWARHPVVLYAKFYSAHTRELRRIFSAMKLNPAPLIIEVDQRNDAPVLLPLLQRLTGVPTLPLLIIGGEPVGVEARSLSSLMEEIRDLESSGRLFEMIINAGASSDRLTKGRKGKAR